VAHADPDLDVTVRPGCVFHLVTCSCNTLNCSCACFICIVLLQALLSGGCPEDHVYPDKGKSRPGWCASPSIFDPITAISRPIGSPGRVEMRPCR
jgi:hypothetical protein